MATFKSFQALGESKKKALRVEKRLLPTIITKEAVNFFTLNFRRQGFLDSSLEKWKPRKGEHARHKNTTKKDKEGRNILVGKGTGIKLSRSIRVLRKTRNSAVIGSSLIYAAVHNYGLRAGRSGFTMPIRKFVGRSKKLEQKTVNIIRKRILNVLK
jgi:phage gpG-like protein